jgi:hypothetical protein
VGWAAPVSVEGVRVVRAAVLEGAGLAGCGVGCLRVSSVPGSGVFLSHAWVDPGTTTRVV